MFDEEKEYDGLLKDKPKVKKSKKEKEIVIEKEEEKVSFPVKKPFSKVEEPEGLKVDDIIIPCDNRECKHTFKSIADKKYAEKAGCPICGA